VTNLPPRRLSMVVSLSSCRTAFGPQFFTMNGSGFTLLSQKSSEPCGMGWNSHGWR
jgi:hypothetical protein